MLKRRILVVNGIGDEADMLAALLEIGGHEVRIAYDGEQAMAAAHGFKPEAVLLDIGMPTLDGYETCRRIRTLIGGKDIFIVALAILGEGANPAKSSQAGFDLHLLKPVDPPLWDELLAVLPPIRRPDF